QTAPDLPQSLYWQTGMLTYLLPLILATFLVGWIRRCSGPTESSQSDSRPSAAAGVAETSIGMQAPDGGTGTPGGGAGRAETTGGTHRVDGGRAVPGREGSSSRSETLGQRRGVVALGVCGLVTFFAGGLSETYLIPQNVALTVVLIGSVVGGRR